MKITDNNAPFGIVAAVRGLVNEVVMAVRTLIKSRPGRDRLCLWLRFLINFTGQFADGELSSSYSILLLEKKPLKDIYGVYTRYILGWSSQDYTNWIAVNTLLSEQ